MSNITTPPLSKFILTFSGLILSFIFLLILFNWTTPWLIFLIFVASLLVIFIFIQPLNGLLFLIILRPTLDIFTHNPIVSLGNYSLNIASLLALLVIFLSLAITFKNPARLKKVPLKFAWILFISLTFISIFYSVDSALSFAEWLRLWSIFSLYLLSFSLTDSPLKLKKLIYAIIFSVFIPGVLAFYQFFSHTGMTIIDEDISNRIFGTFAHPNLLAYYLTAPLALLIFLILNKEKYQLRNLFLYLTFLFSFVLLLLTYTRGAWVVFLLTILTLGVLRYKKFLLGFLLGLILIYFLIPPLNTRVNNLFQYNPYSSIQWRLNLWKDSLKYSQEKIWFGYGLGTANKVILDKRGEKFGSADPHNDYLKILIENGIWGLFSYLLLIFSLIFNLIWSYVKSPNHINRGLWLLLLGISLSLYFMSFADNVLRNTALQWIFWILLGASFSLYQKSALPTKK